MCEIKGATDEVLNDMPEDQIRRIPQGCDHSVAWIIWHIARCEDITINLLVAGSPQVQNRDHWLEQMQITICDTGNTMDEEGVADFNKAINIKALRSLAVRLSASGVETKGVEVFQTGNKYVAFRDPDNIQLEYWLPD